MLTQPETVPLDREGQLKAQFPWLVRANMARTGQFRMGQEDSPKV
jgi:hypothetical protein